MKLNKNIESSGKDILWIYIKAIMAACVFAMLIFFIMALLITYTNISESIIPMLASIVMIISCLISGMYTGAKFKRKGWFNGAIIGFIYVILIIFMSWVLISDFSMGKLLLYKSAIGILAGGVGGMIGVNLK